MFSWLVLAVFFDWLPFLTPTQISIARLKLPEGWLRHNIWWRLMGLPMQIWLIDEEWFYTNLKWLIQWGKKIINIKFWWRKANKKKFFFISQNNILTIWQKNAKFDILQRKGKFQINLSQKKKCFELLSKTMIFLFNTRKKKLLWFPKNLLF